MQINAGSKSGKIKNIGVYPKFRNFKDVILKPAFRCLVRVVKLSWPYGEQISTMEIKIEELGLRQ
jgi:hypothetical protein